jgi:DNA-binding NtrC family response regulator
MAHILLIDDEESVVATLRRSLEEAGHKVAVAGEGRAGLLALAAQKFDLVVTDIIMPTMEGIETILAARERQKDLRILAISGGGRTGTNDFLEIARKFGAIGTLRKPFTPRDFVAEVARCLAAPNPSASAS